MNILEYVKLQRVWILGNLITFLLINLILIGSTVLGDSLQDIIYMDILILIVQIPMIFYDFKRLKALYREIEDAIKEKKDMNNLTLAKGDYYMQLIERIIVIKNKQESQKESKYKENIDLLQEYITQWVHDIKINVAVCDLMLQEVEEPTEGTDTFTLQIEKIKFMVNQVLHVARANNYSGDIEAVDVNIQEEVRSAIKDNAQFFISKNIAIETDIKASHIINDKKWIHYIISQILNNSSKYTPKNGQVLLFTREDDKAIYLHVKDTGIGIPKEDIGRIFHKGFTGSNGRSTTKSTGMGLYYAKKMADRLSIGIELVSEQGVYTEVILTFYKLRDYFNVTKM